MPRYEYKVVPAPKKAGKVKGVKGTEARFAHELASLMNQYGADGWEYQRTDTLPCEERSGLTGRTTTFQNLLVFRRELDTAMRAADAIASVHVDQPAPMTAPAPVRTPPHAEPAPAPRAEAPAPAPTPTPTLSAEPMRTPDGELSFSRAPFHHRGDGQDEPQISARSPEGVTPRLGAASHPEPADPPAETSPGVARRG
ncbi:DUF4177 domain-containing protein [Psychromarinibacter sp. S121]|uniref:DUF4177 domain-containing protein n=1 Tax=Psychromarinibacter sp. S121 TaxID=3415127 RepID=UPI003C7D116F